MVSRSMADRFVFMLADESRETIPPPYPGPYTGHSGAIDPLNSRQPYLKRAISTEKMRLPQRHGEQPGFFHQYGGVWRALPAVLAVIIWSTQMIYFFFWFTSRPANDDGSWHRIGASYAAWPFISCIGAERELCFKLASIIVACLLWITFGIDYFIGRKAPVGKWFRLAKTVFASVSSVFLIALAFSSVNGQRNNHLIFTSFQIILMAFAKVSDWYLNRAMREWLPNNRHLQISKAWKRVAASIALPAGLLVMCGIYGCTAKFVNDTVIFTSQCWSLVSFAATAEWTLSCLWMIFVGTVAYDNYHLEDTVYQLLTTPAPLNPKRSKLAFWIRRRKDDRRRNDLEDESEGLEALRLSNAGQIVDPDRPNVSERNSFAESIDERRAEVYSPLEHQGRTWLPSTPAMTEPGSGNRGYQHVSHAPDLEDL
ncbi:hypothetical protein LTR84_003341 [Exophiala bonariae]|uniref:CWH43-like N-terminal domain-containing protein n=1 Tax=Exophiala bonariae TaxID=1690606 RepID=A0AAV9N6U0_9EURO|nr:hypothetical protein LTR84_003341 [Exophiala bonariae]